MRNKPFVCSEKVFVFQRVKNGIEKNILSDVLKLKVKSA